MDKRKSGETQEAQQTSGFSYMNTLLNKYTIYAQQSIERLSVQNMKEVGERQAESQRMMLIAFCSVIICWEFWLSSESTILCGLVCISQKYLNLVMQNMGSPRWYGTQKG